MKKTYSFLCLLIIVQAKAQPDRWQQKVHYTMDIQMNVKTNQFTGIQKLEYWNNSPDTLSKLFYHLYFNAFQPGSMMDVNSRNHGTYSDWDGRVKDRISLLKPNEIGYQKILSLSLNGKPQSYTVQETILEVRLDKPILPKTKVVLDMKFEAQVPLQIRRSGRDNPNTQVRYSMSQWYPKLCEYDYEGWHPTPYVGREFYGVWGNFEVNITLDKKYILGGTGYLQNGNQIGYGYEDEGKKITPNSGSTNTWKFIAPNVHDFMWAADPEFVHKKLKISDSLTLHLLHNATNTESITKWESILPLAQKAYPFIEKTFGKYPYLQYSFIQGGDGGMEYPMATLLAGAGAWLHEWMHNWYQGLLATNESLYPWMDEGFTTYAENRTENFLSSSTGFAQTDDYNNYFDLVKSGKEEPLSTHADHFYYNNAYGKSSYSKGAVFMEQLGYIVGDAIRDKILLNYYNSWKYKHPNVNDFIQIAEKTSQIKLDWYKEYWVYTTKTIDYGIDSLWEENGKTKIRIKKIGQMPMPIDVTITAKDGTSQMHYIPMNLMYGTKPSENNIPHKVYSPWPFVNNTYIIETDIKIAQIKTTEIDPSKRMADLNRKNNVLNLNY